MRQTNQQKWYCIVMLCVRMNCTFYTHREKKAFDTSSLGSHFISTIVVICVLYMYVVCVFTVQSTIFYRHFISYPKQQFFSCIDVCSFLFILRFYLAMSRFAGIHFFFRWLFAESNIKSYIYLFYLFSITCTYAHTMHTLTNEQFLCVKNRARISKSIDIFPYSFIQKRSANIYITCIFLCCC